eukprot:scaffold80755_cov61-Phaeocystis_antarctica.AAC.6
MLATSKAARISRSVCLRTRISSHASQASSTRVRSRGRAASASLIARRAASISSSRASSCASTRARAGGRASAGTADARSRRRAPPEATMWPPPHVRVDTGVEERVHAAEEQHPRSEQVALRGRVRVRLAPQRRKRRARLRVLRCIGECRRLDEARVCAGGDGDAEGAQHWPRPGGRAAGRVADRRAPESAPVLSEQLDGRLRLRHAHGRVAGG